MQNRYGIHVKYIFYKWTHSDYTDRVCGLQVQRAGIPGKAAGRAGRMREEVESHEQRPDGGQTILRAVSVLSAAVWQHHLSAAVQHRRQPGGGALCGRECAGRGGQQLRDHADLFSCTIFSDMVCFLLSNGVSQLHSTRVLQTMSLFIFFSICETYYTLSETLISFMLLCISRNRISFFQISVFLYKLIKYSGTRKVFLMTTDVFSRYPSSSCQSRCPAYAPAYAGRCGSRCAG